MKIFEIQIYNKNSNKRMQKRSENLQITKLQMNSKNVFVCEINKK